MGLLSSFISPGGFLEKAFVERAIGGRRFYELFENKTNNFLDNQKKTLEKIIIENEGTRWGRDHNFVSMSNHIENSDNSSTKSQNSLMDNSEKRILTDRIIHNWRTQPIVTYAEIEPYIERIRKGDIHSLTSEQPFAFAITSGTTGNPKYIPVTRESFSSQDKGGGIWNLQLWRAHSNKLGKILFLSGSERIKQTEIIPVVSFTGIVKKKQNKIIKERMAYPLPAESVTDYEHRLLIAAQSSYLCNPATIVSVNPLTIIKMIDLMEKHKKELKMAIENNKYIGTNIYCGSRNKSDALSKIDSGSILDFVKLICTWTGGTQDIFINYLKNKGVKVPFRDLGFIASEGRFTIPLEDNTSSGVLNPFGMYYEFLTKDKTNLVKINELKKGEEYNLVVTTSNGLYRYDMQDIVRMDGWHNSAPLISFRRKDSCFSSMVGEKLHENQAAELIKHFNLKKRAYLIAEQEPPHYILALSKDAVISETEADRILRLLNPEYDAKRESGRLTPLCLDYCTDERLEEISSKINRIEQHDRYKHRFLIPAELKI